MSFQEMCDLHGNLLMTSETGIHSTKSPDRQPSFHWSQDSPKPFSYHGHHFPHKLLILRYQNTADNIAMSSDILGHGVHDNIYSQFQRFLKNWCKTGIVNVCFYSMLSCNVCNLPKIHYPEYKGSRTLQNHKRRIFLNGIFDFLHIISTYIGNREIQLGNPISMNKTLYRLIDIPHTDNMAACLTDSHNRCRTCCHTRREYHRPASPLQFRNLTLQNPNGRIGTPSIYKFIILKHVHIRIIFKLLIYVKRIQKYRRYYCMEILIVFVSCMCQS